MEKVKHNCPKCNENWEAEMYFELGGWFYKNEANAYCSKEDCVDENGEPYEAVILEV